MLIALLKLLSRVPMRWYHRIGGVVGWSGYWCARTDAKRLRDNLYGSGVCSTKQEYRILLKQIISQTGQGAAEWVKHGMRRKESLTVYVLSARVGSS